eukprot:CAMPEP_0119321326 /NCGR_PEP_ID=MMETSP1333-20130426/55103_1 /TAXON_ID=418940 /ORGANISM="Scyphosphaera apsteinii, Strain RCC1455" /LENGTH=64 /DNA_ID=CAMNT_0007328277 /DNA_START=16 /DNA_END=207 /DNA_ORIENTATION=+
MTLEVADNGIALVRLNCVGEKQNTLSDKLMEEFESVSQRVESDPNVKAAVLISSKEGSWVAGAD